jgi:hypothetical protein
VCSFVVIVVLGILVVIIGILVVVVVLCRRGCRRNKLLRVGKNS